MDLTRKVSELNQQYFMNTLNIDGVSVIKKADADPQFADPSVKCSAYYLGNRYHGSIYVMAEDYLQMSEEDLNFVLFHEMAHQLVSGHGADFDLVMKRFHGPSTQELVQFAQILKANIELKAKEGVLVHREMLPPIAQNVLRKKEVIASRTNVLEKIGFTIGGIIFVAALIMSILQWTR